jgi:lysozyme
MKAWPPRKASQACYDVIKQSEDEAGFLAGRCSRLTAYLCPAGVWTVGWGHTSGVHEGMTISPEFADALLREDVEEVEQELGLILKVWVTQGQWDALCSLAFNLKGGPVALPRIAPKLWQALHMGRTEEAAKEFLDISKGGGRQLAGLVRRRQAEAALFLRSDEPATA